MGGMSPACSVGLKCARLMSGCVHCDTGQRHYRLATSEKQGETSRSFHSVCRELLVGLLLGVAKDGRERFLCGKVWSQQWTFGGRRKMGKTEKESILKYMSDCLGKRAWGMQKGSVASLWRSRTAGRIFQTFDEQFVAVDEVRPTFSDGLYSKCTPPSPPPPPMSSIQQQQKDPKCTAVCLPMWALCDQTKKRTMSETQRCSVTKPYFYRTRELWTDWVHGVSSQLTDTKLQTKW